MNSDEPTPEHEPLPAIGPGDRPVDGPADLPPPDPLLRARALVLRDLAAEGADTAEFVSLLEDAVAGRAWWVDTWPQGAAYVAGQVAQDVQDRLLDTHGRWPTCMVHVGEPLEIAPELGPDPHWVCVVGCGDVAALGQLPPRNAPS